jgi:hypothetical protein
VCFLCGALGHLSTSFSRQEPSISGRQLAPAPSSPALVRARQSPVMAMLPPSSLATSQFHHIWLTDDNSAKLAAEVKQSLILIADKDIALFEVLDGLQIAFPSSNLWIARYLGNR